MITRRIYLLGTLMGGLAAQEKKAGRLRFEVYRDSGRNREYRWRLLAGNGQTIANSAEGYRNRRDCRHAIDIIQAGARDAQVEEVRP